MKSTSIPYPNPRQPYSVWQFVAHLPRTLRLFTRLFRDARVGALPKAILAAALVYALSPIDFLDDWLPLIGVVDDLALLLLAGRIFIGLCPRAVVEQHLSQLGAS
jgi:uncharacterized membrane protein YkvA (DUF1232 family)